MNTPSENESSGRPEFVTHMVTFGNQYRVEPHPIVGIVSPDGWVTVTASSHEEVREVVIKHFGTHFSTTYPADRFKDSMHFYPLGELIAINAETPRLTPAIMSKAIEDAKQRWLFNPENPYNKHNFEVDENGELT